MPFTDEELKSWKESIDKLAEQLKAIQTQLPEVGLTERKELQAQVSELSSQLKEMRKAPPQTQAASPELAEVRDQLKELREALKTLTASNPPKSGGEGARPGQEESGKKSRVWV